MAKGARAKRATLAPKHCEIPGCDFQYVQKHRIFPGRDGGKYVLGNVIALCPNHHLLADRGLISPDELLRIVTERIAQDAIRQFAEGGTGSNSEYGYIFADQPVEGRAVCWADVQHGSLFVVSGRSSITGTEEFSRSVERPS